MMGMIGQHHRAEEEDADDAWSSDCDGELGVVESSAMSLKMNSGGDGGKMAVGLKMNSGGDGGKMVFQAMRRKRWPASFLRQATLAEKRRGRWWRAWALASDMVGRWVELGCKTKMAGAAEEDGRCLGPWAKDMANYAATSNSGLSGGKKEEDWVAGSWPKSLGQRRAELGHKEDACNGQRRAAPPMAGSSANDGQLRQR